MPYFTSPNERIVGPLPRKDILAVCSFLNRRPEPRTVTVRTAPRRSSTV